MDRRVHPAQLHFDAGQRLRAANDHKAAAEQFILAHIHLPESPEPLLNLGNALRDLGDTEGSISAWQDALALQPWHQACLANLAGALESLGRHDDALRLVERCLILKPDWFNAIANAEVILRGLGRQDDARRWAQRQIALWPEDHRGWMAVAASLHREGKPREALDYQCTAHALAPEDVSVASAMAILRQELGHDEIADDIFRYTLDLAPDDPGTRWNAALGALNAGDLERGWALYEARFDAGTAARRRHFLPDMPQWEGQPLDGGRLLVWREQGIGDEIMWASCYGELPTGTLVECSARLVNLFQRSFPHLEFRPELNGPLPPCTHQIACGSLPRLFRRRFADFWKGAYLKADAKRTKYWLKRHSWPFGISWRSMRSRTGQTARGYPSFGDLHGLDDITTAFISLQYDNPDPFDPVPFNLVVPDLDLKNDIDEVAALIASRGAIVTVANTVGALAGALGVPTAMLLTEGDYTMLGTGSYPWAKSVHAFVKRADEPDWSRQMAGIREWLKTV